jgi:hypothetical protein
LKIDKVIFSTSERFSVYWNLQAQIWKKHLGIEPVCILLGDRSKTNMSEEFGKVIEYPPDKDFPHLIQITWSKFYWPILEPDVTALVGDIDLFPLHPRWFKERIADIPDDTYAHLDADGITQLNGTQYTWSNRVLDAHNMPDLGCPTNMPGHYHCAKGSLFRTGLEQERGSFRAEIDHIVSSRGYRNTRGIRDSDPIEQHDLWCAEELRSTRALRRSIASGKIKYKGLHLRHGIGRLDGDRLDKSTYLFGEARYRYDEEKLAQGGYADLHCVRPFDHVAEDERERRWLATENLLRLAWNDPTLTR